MQLEGKRIIVTGSASGMGAATLRAYVREGAHVIGMDVTDEAGVRVSNEAAKSGPGRADYMHVDVADKKQCRGGLCECSGRNGWP